VASLSEMVIVVRASTRDFTAGMMRTRAEIAKTQTTAQRLNALGGASVAAGKKLTKGLTLPVVALGAASVVMASRFEDDMTLIETQAGGTRKDVEELSKSILSMTHEMGVQHGPEELAKGLYHLKSVGMDNIQAMDALRAAEQLASVGHADLETSANAVAGAWKSGVKGAEDFTTAAAAVNAIVGAGNMRMEELVAAMGTGVLVNAQQAGASFQDVGAALAVMTSRGIPAVRAATSIKMAFAGITNPSGTATKAFKSVGLGQLDLAKAMQKGGLPAAIDLLDKKLKGMGKVEKTQVLGQMFGAKSSQAILTLIGNMDDYRRVQEQVVAGSTDEKFNEAVKAQAKDAGAQWAHLKTTLSGTLVEFGTILLPMVLKVADAFGKFAKWLGGLSSEGKKTVVIVALIAASIGPLLIVTGKMAQGVGALINMYRYFRPAAAAAATAQKGLSASFLASPVFWVVIAIVALVAIFIILWKRCKWFRDFWKGLWEGIKKVAATVWTAIKPSLDKIWQAIKAAWAKVWAACQWLWPRIKPYIVLYLRSLWTALKFYWHLFATIVRVGWHVIVAVTRFLWPLVVRYVRNAIFAIRVVVGIIKVVVAIVRAVWHAVAAVTRAVWKVIAFVVKQAVGRVVTAVHIVQKVVAVVRKAWHMVRSVTSTIWNGLKKVIGAVIEWIWGKLTGIFGKLKGVYEKVKGWLGGGDDVQRVGKGASRRLPRRAGGGWIPATTGGQAFLGGEGGEGEWVVPASKAKGFAQALGGGGGNTANVTINIANVNGTDRQAARKLAEMVKQELMGGVLRHMVGHNA